MEMHRWALALTSITPREILSRRLNLGRSLRWGELVHFQSWTNENLYCIHTHRLPPINSIMGVQGGVITRWGARRKEMHPSLFEAHPRELLLLTAPTTIPSNSSRDQGCKDYRVLIVTVVVSRLVCRRRRGQYRNNPIHQLIHHDILLKQSTKIPNQYI